MRKIKLFLSLLMLIAFSVGNVWADPAAAGTTLFSENFGSYSADDVPSGSVSAATGRVIYGGGSVTYTSTNGTGTKPGTTKIWNENTGGGTAPEILVGKQGTSGTPGSFKIAGIPSGGAQVITVSWTQNKQLLTGILEGTGYSTAYTFPKPTTTTATISFDITVADGADETFDLTLRASSSNVRVDDILITVKTAGEGGSSTPTCATPTFDPEDGETFDESISVELATTTDGATIYYTTDGTTPTTSSSAYSTALNFTETTTVKAIAAKEGANNSAVASATYTKMVAVHGYTVDFESDLAAYVNWDFSNIAVSTEISAHDGTYYGNTDGKASASITTKAKVASPGTLTFYISKESKNTTESYWKAQVSSDGTEWTDVETFDATSMSKGAWNECSADLSAHSNVYVRIAYSGSTAIRAIDDIELAMASAVAKPTISGEENFVGSTSVSISHADADHIYYTTNGDAPTTSSAVYSAPFPLTNTATVKAIAVKGSDVSAVAEKTFTKVEALESLAALLDATTSTETAFNVVISNWVVTGVSGTRAWIADAANEKGILLYKSGHNFVAGNKLNGVVLGTKTKLYQGYPELTSLVSTDVTVTTTEAITPRTTTIAALTSGHPNEQGTVVKLENLTYTASTTSFSDGENSIQADNKLYTASLLDGATYNLTGVVEYLDEAVVKIMPRSVDDVELTGEASLPEVTGLAALKAETTGSSYLLNLTDAVVTLVDGNNAFIEDATAGALIYFSGHGFAAGDKLNGQYEVTTSTYQGKFEITAMEAQTGATKEADAEIPVTTLTIAQLAANFAANESKRIKIVGVNVTDAISSGDRNGAISDGANTFALYAGKNGVTAAENANIDVIGYPTFFNEAHQFNVWAQADITVNEKEDPELAYTPASETIEQGASWSAPTLTNPHNVAISSYASDNESVATVTDGGVIALAGGLGTAVITAHFNGDATYNAGNATYTITVEEADARNKATGSAFEAISGNLTPADITFAAYKGDGTTTPVINSSNIRLYKPASGKSTGSYLTLKAKVGCTIDQVQITFASSATAAYSVDDAALPTSAFITGKTELLTPSGLNAQSVSIVNLKNGSIDVSEIKVWYTGSPLAIDHYFLGGTYETTFEQNGTFDYTGLELYASYDAGETIIEEITDFTVVADLSVVGPATASVQVNSVEVTTYVITVTAGKEDPALAYSPVSETITAGDAWSAPILSNTFNVSPITYSSDKESVAIVDENGVISLAGGYGTAVITAHFDESTSYIESEATYTITVNKPAPTPTSTVYRKVTATADITDGEYLIVYEGDATHDAAVFDGSLDNDHIDVAKKVLAVEIENDEIAGNTELDAAVFTIDVTAGTLQSASGLYIGRTNYDNGMDKSTTETYVNTFAITDGAAVIKGVGNCTLRYNYAVDQLRFRYYKSGQQAIQLYKKETPVPPTSEDVRTGLELNRYYTICLGKDVTAATGATFWNLEHRNSAGTEVYLEEVNLPLEAGKPYIFQATATTLNVTYGDETQATPVENGALRGTFDDLNATQLAAKATHVYILIQNSIRPAGGENSLKANRAYIDYDELVEVSDAPQGAPGKRVRAIPMQPKVATGMDALNVSDKPVKMIINGQLFILRGEKLYDATGRLVK